MNDHRELKQRSDGLLTRWGEPHNLPYLPRPADTGWISRDGQELDWVMGWSGDRFDPAWCGRIHRFVERTCVDDSGAWSAQRAAFGQFYARFFCATECETPVLNLVTVTPSRIPSRVWPTARGTTLVEQFRKAPSLRSSAEPFDLEALVNPVILPIASLMWSRRARVKGRSIPLGEVVAERTFGTTASEYRRLFQIDGIVDAKSVRRGSVPAVSDTVTTVNGQLRLHAPMIQLWKVYATGVADLVNIETLRGSGLVIGIRYTSQLLVDIVEQDPRFGVLFAELDRLGKSRWSR